MSSRVKDTTVLKKGSNETRSTDISREEIKRLISDHELTDKYVSNLFSIFEEPDKDKLGKVKRSSFFHSIAKTRQFDNTTIIDEIDQYFQSEGEVIAEKLLYIKSVCMNHNEQTAINYIDNILDTLIIKELNDFDYSSLRTDESNLLKYYSLGEVRLQRKNDLAEVNKSSKCNNTESFTRTMNSLRKQDYQSSRKENIVQINERLETNSLNLINQELNKLEDFDFDIFNFNRLTNNNPLLYISKEIFNLQYFFDDLISVEVFNKFILEITKGYSREKAGYHNDIHAADVLQTTYLIVERGSFYYKLYLSELDYLSILLSAICHDFKHPGIGNSYLINSAHDIAFSFNDMSPLENYHILETFKVLAKKEFNILGSFQASEYRIIRRRMIEGILSTDMTQHSKNINALKNKLTYIGLKESNYSRLIQTTNDDSQKFELQQLVINNILHTADISNPAKPSSVYRQWVGLIFEEFFAQGDIERKSNYPISMLCDRYTTKIPNSQLGFIKYVVKPSFDILKQLAPEVKTYIDYMNNNLRMYQDEVDKDD